MKQILVIKDPDGEVGFDVLCKYSKIVQEQIGKDVVVLPIWPHGEMELIGDKRKMKLVVKELKELIDELRLEDSENE